MKPVRTPNRTAKHQERMDDVPADSYRAEAKPHGPLACPKCGASYHQGRWSWEKAAPDAARHKCPACRRIEDKFPAGYVTLGGPFLEGHRDEILAVVRSSEAREREEHPLQRIMGIEPGAADIVVTTTDPHLARSIVHALHEAFKGDVDIRFSKDEALVRASWRR